MAKKKAKIKTPCNCVEQVNKELAELRQAKLSGALVMNFATGKGGVESPLLETQWLPDAKKRGKTLPTIFCTYCPFCGQKKSKD